MTMAQNLDFARSTAPEVTNWTRRVADHLAALPAHGWTPLQDWALFEHFSGQDPAKLAHVKGYLGTGSVARVHALMSVIRNRDGVPTLDGRKALLIALRAKAYE